MTVGRDDLVQSAPELHAVQGIPCRLVSAGFRGLCERGQQVSRCPGPGRGRLRERCDVTEWRYWTFSDLGYAMALPADACCVRFRGLQDNWTIVAAFDVGEGLERDRDRVELAKTARLDVLDC